MSTNQTPNYGLNQWERTDKIQMDDFNADNAKLDAALGDHAAVLSEHAGTLSEHAGELSRLGNCAVYVGTHIGTGDGLPVVLTVPGRPMVLMVQDGLNPLAIVALRGMEFATPISANQSYGYQLVWGEHSVSWCHGTSLTYSLNYKDRLYFYLILATMDD